MARSKAAGRSKRQQSNQTNAKKAIVCSVCGKGDGKYKCPKCRSPFCCVQCSKDHKANYCPATTLNDNDDVLKQQQEANTSTTSPTTTTTATIEPQSKYLPTVSYTQSSKKKRKRPSNQQQDDDDSDSDQPGWNITSEMKQALERSEWLRKELQDGGLRCLIEEIDAASDIDEEDNKRRSWGRNNNGHKKQKNTTDISQRVLTLARTKHSHPKFATFVDRLLLTAGVLTGGGGDGESECFEGGEGRRLELVPVPRRGGELVTAAAAASGGGDEAESSSEEEDSDDDSSSSSDSDDDESSAE